MRKELRGKLLLAVYVLLLVLTVALVLKLGEAPEEEKKVGFVTTGDFDNPGWNAGNYAGIQAACEAAGMKLLVRDQVPENDGSCVQAVQELADEGAEMIVLSSFGYSQDMEVHFTEYPQVAFFVLLSNLDIPNVTGYSTRIYQARYLSGIVAGMRTESDRIGFVATELTNEVCRNVDAFALGVRRVNPDAEILLSLTGPENQDEKAAQAAHVLIEEEQVDVITHHEGQYSVIDVAEEMGIASVGYYEQHMERSENYLTCAACDWEILYHELVREYLRGQSNYVIADWLGLDSGAVGLTAYSPLVSQEAIDEVERAQKEILSGMDVFTNEIYDNQGRLRCGAGEAMSDDYLLRQIDWLVEGVHIYE